MDLKSMTTREISALALACSKVLRDRQFALTGFGDMPMASDEDVVRWGAPAGKPLSERQRALGIVG